MTTATQENVQISQKSTLEQARNLILKEVQELYDFGDWIVEDIDGWQSTHPGREYTCVVYMAPGEDVDTESPDYMGCERVYLNVIFKDNNSAELEEVYAIDHKGNFIGSYEKE